MLTTWLYLSILNFAVLLFNGSSLDKQMKCTVSPDSYNQGELFVIMESVLDELLCGKGGLFVLACCLQQVRPY